MGSLLLYITLHIDGSDGKAAFLIERHSAVILGMNPQNQFPAAKGFGKCPDIRQHRLADPMAPDSIIHADAFKPHLLYRNRTGTALMNKGQHHISRNILLQLRNINQLTANILQEFLLRIGLVAMEVNIRPPIGMEVMDLNS